MDDISAKIQQLLGDEESMKQIKELADMFKSEAAENTPPPAENDTPTPAFNPADIFRLMGVFSEPDENCRLIEALKPHLSIENRHKADRVIKFLKIYNVYIVMRDSGMLENLDKLL